MGDETFDVKDEGYAARKEGRQKQRFWILNFPIFKSSRTPQIIKKGEYLELSN